MRRCAYCTLDIPDVATRCPHCAGEYRRCPRCKRLVTVKAVQKFVGLLRGGTKTQYRCGTCNTLLDGPR